MEMEVRNGTCAVGDTVIRKDKWGGCTLDGTDFEGCNLEGAKFGGEFDFKMSL